MLNQTKITIHDIFAAYFDNPLIKRLAYTVSKKLEEGHICYELNQENDENGEVFDNNLLKESTFITDNPTDNIQPFVILNNKIYLHRYYYYETNILDKVNSLIQTDQKDRENRIKDLLKTKEFISTIFKNDIDESLDIDLQIPWQMIAVFSSVLNDFSIITGGPGTGKTTTITKLLAILFFLNPDLNVALAAPTGKAAARLNDSIINGANSIQKIPLEIKSKFLELKAQTIHRLLGVKYNSPDFKHNKENPLKYDIIIIDESSMIDVTMMSKLLDSIDSNSKLVLLGDKEQLSSIEAGSIFGDLCKTQNPANNLDKADIDLYNSFIEEENLKIPQKFIAKNQNVLTGCIIELKRSFRFKNTEGIGKFSNLVINGISDKSQLIDSFQECNDIQQCVRITNNYNDSALNDILNKYEDYIVEPDIEKALKKLNLIKVLCAVKEGKYGVNNYNTIIETYLKSKGLLSPKNGFYHNQIIMITSNDYSLGLFNGDIGIVRKDPKTKQLRVYFHSENKIINFPTSNINSYNSVFAMTIHKSQGSEFENVVIILPKDDENKLLSRELIYTAVTRAKNNVLIITDNEVLTTSIQKKTQRVSGIIERISQI